MDTPDRRPTPAELGPVTGAYVRSVGWRSVNLHTHISLVHRYVYVEVPKAGCGTMKATLGGLEAARMGPSLVERVQERPHDRSLATPFVKPFQLPADLLEDVLTSSEYRRFAVVREPASRLLSAYLEKIRQGLKQSQDVVKALQASTGRTIASQDVTLAQFVEVVSAQPSRQQDPHWRRQADHLGVGIVDYDTVIHLEDLDRSWDLIGALTSVPGVQEQYFCANATKAATHMAEFYTPALLDQVATAYARDYEAFAYPAPPSI